MTKYVTIKAVFETPPIDQAMSAVWHACQDANVQIPQEVLDYYNGQEPSVVTERSNTSVLAENVSLTEEGVFSVFVPDIPQDTHFLRFEISDGADLTT